ncbi:hypothetical protein GV828_08255 [Flavobacterium sp. NST-5]|uniref:Phage integrase SAM-like domain-containing protein n=1 Tax=Flavobacterium ichthyis TaxID=2698827 RepID=A0ABW9ZEI4_9FLAO|nr:DUF6155 family protein [Flavobacterium ichthyis]NBL65188.1 hypothetical protein [Flavobacterium ichthyis]
MSKRDLKKYVKELSKAQLEEQFIEMYNKFSDVKTYYDFVFNPKEDKLAQEAKLKISNEYFPTKTKRAKLRRSTAQKIIKHFLSLGVDPFIVTDVMLHNIEVAQKYTAKREMRYDSFYKSMLNSFEQIVKYAIENAILSEFKSRIIAIQETAKRQRWQNYHAFENVTDIFD